MSIHGNTRRTVADMLRRSPFFGPASQAATAVAIYTLLIISRVPEVIPLLRNTRPLLTLALITGAFALGLSRTRLPAVLRAPETRAVFAIFVMAVITIPTALWPGQSLRLAFFGFSKTFIFFFLLLYCTRTFHEFRRLVWAVVGAAGALGLASVVLKGAAGRAHVGAYDPNDTAFVIVCLLPVVVMVMVGETGGRRWLLAPVVGLLLMAAILTQSRGGFVGLLVVGLILLGRLPSRQAGLKIGVVAGGLLIFFLFAPQSYWDRMATIWGGETVELKPDEYVAGGLSTARWEVWKTGVRLTLENPLLGVGLGNFSIAEGLTHGGTEWGSGKWQAPHNSFTQIGAELGLIGLGLLLYLLYRAIRNCREVIRVTRKRPGLRLHLHVAQGLETSFYGYMVAGMALSQAYSDVLYALIGVAVLLKWQTARAVQELAERDSRAVTSPGHLPWWKQPR